jgi:cytochrome d ubiquinol oxidase subunit II
VSKAEAAAAVLWVGVTFYAVFGGADFGAGMWALLAGPHERNIRARQLVAWAIGPVWEANHVWLIFVLVVLWTAFPTATEAIFSTLFIPLSLAALGIVLRGAGFAFHKLAPRVGGRLVSEGLFGASSVLTPFFLGTVVGAIAGGRVPVGNAAGDAVTSWLNPLSLLIGGMFVATGAYLSAVFLISDAHRAGADDLVRYFRTRALVAATVAGVFAVAGIFALRSDARFVYDGLTSDGLPLVILSAVCGLGALAIGAVAGVIWGWAVGQHPYLLPTSLTIDAGASTGDTLTALLIVFGVAVVVVLPAMGLLYALSQRSRLEGEFDRPGAR